MRPDTDCQRFDLPCLAKPQTKGNAHVQNAFAGQGQPQGAAVPGHTSGAASNAFAGAQEGIASRISPARTSAAQPRPGNTFGGGSGGIASRLTSSIATPGQSSFNSAGTAGMSSNNTSTRAPSVGHQPNAFGSGFNGTQASILQRLQPAVASPGSGQAQPGNAFAAVQQQNSGSSAPGQINAFGAHSALKQQSSAFGRNGGSAGMQQARRSAFSTQPLSSAQPGVNTFGGVTSHARPRNTAWGQTQQIRQAGSNAFAGSSSSNLSPAAQQPMASRQAGSNAFAGSQARPTSFAQVPRSKGADDALMCCHRVGQCM